MRWSLHTPPRSQRPLAVRDRNPGSGRRPLASPVAVAVAAMMALAILAAPQTAHAQGSRFERTDSRSQYVHRILIYDAQGRRISPDDDNPAPYSPKETCAKCHDYEAISHGYHFNAPDPEADPGRLGEPWVWTEPRSGSQIPLSFRDWEGTYKPEELGMDTWSFTLTFGRHFPGGGPAGAFSADSDDAKWNVAGQLAIDCMVCHDASGQYRQEVWAEQIERQNFAWAPAAALGLAEIEGSARGVPADFDPSEAGDSESGPSLPETHYDQQRFDSDGRVFFDITGTPSNNACYRCHTAETAANRDTRWVHEQDVHLKAGLSCVDCHRNGIGHHTIRGYPGEEHPTGQSVETLSCRGCHMGAEDEPAPGDLAALGGRLGSPEPAHAGIPPLHFEKMSCTACHSGPLPEDEAIAIHTSMAHELGLPTQSRGEQTPPGIRAPVFLENEDGKIAPHRAVWPAFWGYRAEDGTITPIPPDEAADQLRRPLRIRRDFREEVVGRVRLSSEDKVEALGEDRAEVPEDELTEQERAKLEQAMERKKAEAFREKLADAFGALQRRAPDGAEPVFISGGKAYRMAEDSESVQTFETDAAEPYTWPLSHDVRPARQSLGAAGCADCHSPDAPIYYGTVAAAGPAPDADPPTAAMHELRGEDLALIGAWEQMFAGRSTFKIIAVIATALIAAVLLGYGLLGVMGLSRWINQRRLRVRSGREEVRDSAAVS